jgi:hypothetical protein
MGASALLCLTIVAACRGEAAAAAGTNGFSLSNVMFFFELRRTNPAMLEGMNKKWAVLEDDLLVNGHRMIPYLFEFATLFPTNIEFREYSTGQAERYLWNMQTGLYGRYLLRMQVRFRVDDTRTNIVSYDPPELFLSTYDDQPPSTRDYSKGCVLSERTFAASDWTRLLRAGGDLRAIGFKAWTNRPIENFHAEWRHRTSSGLAQRDRYP